MFANTKGNKKAFEVYDTLKKVSRKNPISFTKNLIKTAKEHKTATAAIGLSVGAIVWGVYDFIDLNHLINITEFYTDAQTYLTHSADLLSKTNEHNIDISARVLEGVQTMLEQGSKLEHHASEALELKQEMHNNMNILIQDNSVITQYMNTMADKVGDLTDLGAKACGILTGALKAYGGMIVGWIGLNNLKENWQSNMSSWTRKEIRTRLKLSYTRTVTKVNKNPNANEIYDSVAILYKNKQISAKGYLDILNEFSKYKSKDAKKIFTNIINNPKQEFALPQNVYEKLSNAEEKANKDKPHQ